MKRLFFGIVALCVLVACSGDKGAAEKQMADYKQQWVDITSVVDAEAIDAEGFDAWYNALSNIELRNVNKAIDKFEASYKEVDHWYKNLKNDEQEAARNAAIKWERENVAAQHQVELFCTEILDLNLGWEWSDKEKKYVAKEDLAERPLLNMLPPEDKGVDAPKEEAGDVTESPSQEESVENPEGK